jgi:membrane-bound ClpP family serine protease
VISLALLALAIGLLAADLFLPTAGIVLVLSLICAAGSILFGFRHSYDFGIGLLIFELALVPIFAFIFVKLWPKTPLGRRMIIEPEKAESFQWEADTLVGRVGITLCDLVPAGDIEIEGRHWDATSRVGLIERGTQVKVVAEEMGQLYVIPVSSRTSPKSPKPTSSFDKESLLDRPAEDLGIEQLE